MSLSFNQSVIEEFRSHAGKVGGPFAGGDLLLLTTTGARTGRPHTTPLGYVADGDRLLVVGSNLGAPSHPAWYRNLLVRPVVDVEVGTEKYEAIAVPAEGARRDALFELIVRVAPGYGDYQAATERVLPVVALERSEAPAGEGPAEVNTLADKILEVHTWLRHQLREVRAEADAHFAASAAHRASGQPGGPPAPGLGLQIRQRCLAFCQALEFHHTGEDGHVFPVMAGYHPHLADVFERLREEHLAIGAVQSELAALLDGVVATVPERFRTELARMSQQLNAHFAYEEEQLLPVLADVPWPPAKGPDTAP